jgi:5'-deoxynucleotidase YfbR-like HD superfamily hydrolase
MSAQIQAGSSHMPENSNLESQITFLVEVDKLKSVLRRNYVIHGNRRENSAEHSWHAALCAISLAEHSNEAIDVNRVMRMLIIHDIVEVDAGDTFIYDDANRETQASREEEAADRLFALLPSEQGRSFRDLWNEFEALKLRLLQKQGSPRLLIVLSRFYTTTKRTVAAGATMESNAIGCSR